MSIRINKYIFLILVLLSMIFVVSIGYGKYSSAMNIAGTANFTGDFKIEFQNPLLVNSLGINVQNTKIEILENTLSVNVADLAHPGAGAEFSVDIVNSGSIPAKIDAINNIGTDNKDIKFEILNKIDFDRVLNPNDKYTIHFIIKWDENSINKHPDPLNFKLNINYIQAI